VRSAKVCGPEPDYAGHEFGLTENINDLVLFFYWALDVSNLFFNPPENVLSFVKLCKGFLGKCLLQLLEIGFNALVFSFQGSNSVN